MTATAYAEGLVALGPWLLPVFGFLVGALGAGLLRLIHWRFRHGHLTAASLATTYFVYSYLSWLNSGGITQLVHVLIVIGYVATYVCLRVVDYLSGIGTPSVEQLVGLRES